MPLTPMKTINETLHVWGDERSLAEYGSLDDDIEALRALDLTTASDADVSSALDRVGWGYVTRVMHSAPQTSFRARRADELWRHTRDLVAPPPKYARIGRFNRARKPVRYFASDPHTAVLELRPQAGEQFVILVQKFCASEQLAFAQFGLTKMPTRTGPYAQLLYDNIQEGLAEEENILGYTNEHGIREKWLRQDTFFNELATQLYPENEASLRYRITGLLGRQMLRMREAKGMFYPTAQNNYMAANIALPEKQAKKALLSVEAWLLEVGQEIEPPNPNAIPGQSHRVYGGRVLRRGTIQKNGRIVWDRQGDWCPHALHKEIAPVPGVSP